MIGSYLIAMDQFKATATGNVKAGLLNMGFKFNLNVPSLVVLALMGLYVELAAPVVAEQEAVVQVEAVWSRLIVHRGDTSVLAVVIDIHEPFHVNRSTAQLDDPFLIPSQLEVEAVSEAIVVGRVQYPPAGLVTVGPMDQPRQVQAYEKRVVLYVPVSTGESAALGRHKINLALTYQACDRTQCLPPVTEAFETSIEVVDSSVPIVDAIDNELFAGFDGSTQYNGGESAGGGVEFDLFGWGFGVDAGGGLGYLILLLIASLGGLLLNFTPCVLPVIPLKVLSLNQVAGGSGRRLVLGLAMSMGVMAFWVALGAMIAGVSGFTATNQLFQYPIFTISVGVVIAVMAVGMCGLFSVRLPDFVYRINPRHYSITGSVGFGVMTAVLSTPCTAPFMGSAAAWAAGQHPATTLTTFAAIGFGMAFPYFLLSSWPGLVDRMPRTGPASELIKQVMGLLLLSAAAYFIGVGLSGWWVSPPDPPSIAYWWPVMGFIAAAGVWMGYRTVRMTKSRTQRVVFTTLGVVLVVGSAYGASRLTDHGPIKWVYYTPQRFDAATGQGKVVVMDFTAEWCLNCKWLERNVLHRPSVVELLQRDDVVAMKVDLTGNNELGNRKLSEVGRLTIPLLVIFAPDGEEVFKSDFYTVEQVVEAIHSATATHVR